jgi:hypothetical protein
MAASVFIGDKKERRGDMELMQLEMFVAVVEERSFRLAAERVFRTQPAVSIGLRKLEDEIGVPLLDRSRRQSGVLTPRGEVLYEYAARVLRIREEMLSALKEQESAVTGTLRVAVAWNVALDWMEPTAKQFNAQYPNLRMEVLCDCADKVLQDLHERRVDVALLSGRPRGTPGLGNLIFTRLVRSKPQRPFWIARRIQGQSIVASAFERELRSQSESVMATGPSGLLLVGPLTAMQRASLGPEVVPARHDQGRSRVAVLKLRRS